MRRVQVVRIGLVGALMGATLMIAQQPYPPQGYPPQGYPQQYPPQGYPQQVGPQQYPPQGYPQQVGPQQYPPQQGMPQQDPNAQGQMAQDQAGQPVARMGVMDGQVSVRRGDSGDWVAAVMNAPLMAGDSVSVSPGGRSELQLDYGDFVRIGGDTEIRISDLEPNRNQIQLARGLITYRVLRNANSQAEISTPSAAVHPQPLSSVRVEIAPDGITKITVRRGDAEVSTPQGSEHVHEGQMMLVRGTPDNPEFQVYSASARDAWDGWNDQRDGFLEKAQSNRLVSPDIYGAEDLDPYGRWGYDPSYGNVWTPSVPPGWAPYQNGQWVWEDYYGWTWVDYDPWGWAPFHYGSWYLRAGFGWTWFPGPRVGHYWYRPALVGFFGFGGGGGIGVGFGFGNIGWVALAPFEIFHPWYGPGWFGGRGIVANSFNVVRNVNIASTFRNASVFGAARGISSADFGRGAFGSAFAINRTQLAGASLVRGAVPLAPTGNNLRFTNHAASVSGPRGELSNQHFFSRMNPGASAAQRTPFAQQQSAMRSAMGSSGGNERSFNSGRSGAAGPAARPSNESGWQRFGEPNSSAGNRAPGSGGSWDRFGSPAQGRQGFAAPQAGRPAYGGGQGYAQQGGRSLQVAPPIVRQREAAPPSYNRGGGGQSAPAYRAPSGGGGGQRSGGSHGGGSHGGGGHR